MVTLQYLGGATRLIIASKEITLEEWELEALKEAFTDELEDEVDGYIAEIWELEEQVEELKAELKKEKAI